MKTSRSLNIGLFLGFSILAAWPATYTDTLVPGWNMIANHLDAVPNNGINNVLTNPPPPETATVIFFNPATQGFNDPWAYFGGFGWFSASDPSPDGAPLDPGAGAFFFNPTPVSITQVFTGAAPAPPAPVALPLNELVVLSHQSATAAPATYFDIVGALPAVGFCTRLYRWNRALQQYEVYTSSGGPWNPSAPSIPRGESVFIIQASPDNVPPTLVNATIDIAGGTILLEFSESMHPTPAQNILNYTLIAVGGPAPTITSAQMYPITTPPLVETKFVRLNVAGLVGTSAYKLNISGLSDLCNNSIDSCTQVGLNCAPPANDMCYSATPAVLGANPGTVVCATTDGYSAWDGIGMCPGADVWYTYTPPCNGLLTLSTCGSPLNTVISVWDGCPITSGTTELWGDNDTCAAQEMVTLPFDVSSCKTYYIRVSGFNGAFGTFTLTLAFAAGPPANDPCASATVIGNGVFPFDNCMATTDGPGPQPANDVWFSYTPACSGPVYLNTCGSTFDTVLAVYAGGCAGTLMGFNNNAIAGPCPASLQSYVTFLATAATTYYIRVGSTSVVASGCGKLTVVGPNPLSGTCPPGIPSQGGTGGDVMMTRLFQVTGISSGAPWAWCISAPCCYLVDEPFVAGVLPVGAPQSALIAAFVASINGKCPQPPALPYTLTAAAVVGSSNLMALTAWGCYPEIIFSVGPAGAPCEDQCVVPNPFDYLPTAGPCSFNPPIVEIPLSRQDCNTNRVDDLLDILEGRSADLNGNRVPDECETCERPRFVTPLVSQQAKPGERVVFNAEAKGGGTLSYQWLFHQNPIAGATEPRLVIDPVRPGDAGEYQLAVNYECGQLRSAPVRLRVAGGGALQISFQDGRVIVSWGAQNMLLQGAPELNGKWTTLSNAVSPFIISQPVGQQFFRLSGQQQQSIQRPQRDD